MKTEDDWSEQELTLHRFHRLIAEILRGETMRTVFQPWEVEILLDIENCVLERRRRGLRLRQYMRAVRRQLETGPGPPMKFSVFLQTRRTRRPSIE